MNFRFQHIYRCNVFSVIFKDIWQKFLCIFSASLIFIFRMLRFIIFLSYNYDHSRSWKWDYETLKWKSFFSWVGNINHRYGVTLTWFTQEIRHICRIEIDKRNIKLHIATGISRKERTYSDEKNLLPHLHGSKDQLLMINEIKDPILRMALCENEWYWQYLYNSSINGQGCFYEFVFKTVMFLYCRQ